MTIPNPDAIYGQMVAHYRGCTLCTAAHDCPEGHRLLMAWGDAEAKAADQDWWHVEAERAAAHGVEYREEEARPWSPEL